MTRSRATYEGKSLHDKCPVCGGAFNGDAIHIDKNARKVYYRGVDLFPRSHRMSDTFITLHENFGLFITIEVIMKNVYGAQSAEPQAISVLISDIRKILRHYSVPLLIINEYGNGWKLLHFTGETVHA